MKKSNYREERIAFAVALKQAEMGLPVAEVIVRMGERSRPSTAGGRCMVGWARANRAV